MNHSLLKELTLQECYRLLPTAQVGRLVFTERALPAVHPVNFLLAGADIVIRTGPAPSSPRQGAGTCWPSRSTTSIRTPAPDGACSWWVGRPVTDIDEIVALAEPARRPWVPGRREHLVRIAGERVSGRRLSLGPTDTEPR